jgi:hypothetical protein
LSPSALAVRHQRRAIETKALQDEGTDRCQWMKRPVVKLKKMSGRGLLARVPQ